jgi:Autotransporter beta-domain
MFRHCMAAAAALGGCSLASTARAQSYVNPNPGGSSVVSFTQFDTLSFTPPTLVTVQQSLSVTQLIGRLNHGTILYDRTFNATFSSPTVQDGVTAAIAAITSAGGPGVVITGPTLVSHAVTTASSTASVYSLNPSSQDPVTHQPVPSEGVVTSTSVFGPTSVQGYVPIPDVVLNPDAGVLIRCNVNSLPSATRPVCTPVDPGVLNVLPGQLDIGIRTERIFLIDTATTTTETTTTSEVYNIDGMSVRGVGTVHGAGVEAGFDQSERFVRRLADAGRDPGPAALWAEAYGYRTHVGAAGDFPGSRNHGEGINGGFGHDFGAFRLGAAIDYGTSRIDEAAAGESADLRLGQVGLHGAWRSGPWSASLAATYGWGRLSTQVAPVGLTAAASSLYGLSTAALSGEAGYRIARHGFALTPSVGAAYTHIRSDAFTETGSPLALTGEARSTGRTKGWLGLAAETVGGRLNLRAYGRAVAFGGDRQVSLPVTFVGSTTALAIDGPDTGRFGADLGAALSWHVGAGVELYGAYDARLRSHYSLQTGSVGVRVSF